jgi:hypothetical protein
MEHLPNINAHIIPHKRQRYETSGDYFKKGGELCFRISKTKADYEFLVLIHELTEYYLTQRNKISLESIDRFDMEFEKNRQPGDISEPGDDPTAPYFKEHQFATMVERLVAAQLEISWKDYEKHMLAII